MCGIWGFVGRDTTVATAAAWRGLDSLTDRGPDDSGAYVADEAGKGKTNIFLGNRRLSILDLSSAGSQPMRDADTDCRLVYNGELYNYRELREELTEVGHDFDSDSDTEVVLRAYVEYGVDCIKRFRGMYAFAIWDPREGKLFAARDRLGIKPFYFAHDDGQLAFASEVTALLEGDVVEPKLDPHGVEGFLAFGSVPEPLTIIEGVEALPAGSTLEFDRATGDCTIESYWQPTFGEESVTPEDIWDRLVDSVSLRLRSDVPVGAFLSGGLDSTAIVAAMRAVDETSDADADIRTVSIEFGETAYSEGDIASRAADDLGTEHVTRTVTADDVASELGNVFGAMDQPTVDGVNTYFVSKAAVDEGLKVALSGVGGDELFYGYPSFTTVPRLARITASLGWLPSIVADAVASLAESIESTTGIPGGAIADAVRAGDDIAGAYAAVRGLFPTAERRRLLEGERPGYDAVTAIADSLEGYRNLSGGNTVSYLELSWYMRNQLLSDTDVMSMAHSLEVRVPLLDSELVETATSATEASMTEGPRPKPLLNRAAEGQVPDYVREREKTGFEFPFAEWLDDELSEVVEDALAPRNLSDLPLDANEVDRIRAEFEAGEKHWSRIWSLVVLSRWTSTHL